MSSRRVVLLDVGATGPRAREGSALVGSLTGSVTGLLGSLTAGTCSPVTDTYGNGATSTYTVVTRTQTGNLITDLLGNVFSTLLNVDRTIVSVGQYKGITRRVAMDIKLGSSSTPTS